MKLSPKLMHILSAYSELKFGYLTEEKVYMEDLLAAPSKTILRDMDNIFAIIYNVRTELLKIGTTEKRLKLYSYYGFAPIAYFFSKIHDSKFTITELDELVEAVRMSYDQHTISYQPYVILRKSAILIKRYYSKGFFEESDATNLRGSKVNLSAEFENLLRYYTEKIGDYYSLSQNNSASRLSAIRMFLAQLERQGVNTIKCITRQEISECITQNAQHYSIGSKNWVYMPRKFLRFLFDEGITPEDFSTAIPETLPIKRVIRSGFSDDEIAAMLKSVDKTGINGKRDYAIMMIAAKTGLRAVDILNLKINSIDWHADEIRIIQQKTGNMLCLPLAPEVGNAIAAYILTSRPKSKAEYIFVKRFDVDQPLTRQNVSAIVTKYMRLTGASDNSIPHRGIHSFRRSFGKSLLESEVPIDMINELLGHADMNSSRPYLAIDENGLRECALTLSSVKLEWYADVL